MNPLECLKCHHEMKIISVINDKIVKKQILEHLGLWEEKESSRSPPDTKSNDVSYEPYHDDWSDNEAVNF